MRTATIVLASAIALTASAVAVVPVAVATPASATPVSSPTAAAAATVGGGTVTQDALPTVQINGIVWAQTTVGNTVYAVGKFTSARPAGSPAGQNEIPRVNILAYDIRTGVLNTSFVHTLNAQGTAIAASPDGSRVYVGGQFTQVDGVNRYRVAAFSTATGALLPFAPTVNATVSALAVSDSTVYLGGGFGSVNGAPRTRLAAVTQSGALTTWAPSADNGVNALVVTPDGTKVVAGGRFANLNGVSAHAIGALSVTTGATVPYGMSQVTADGSNESGVLSLSTDGTAIYGGAYAYQSGNFEGTFALDPATGDPLWINDCWGDTYSVAPVNGALYVASHAHACSGARWFPDSLPTHYFGLAYGTAPSSNYNVVDGRGWDYSRFRTSSLLQWNPRFTGGAIAGQSVWSFTGNSSYVAAGGEFPKVNGTPQQGLVRFAVHSLAPNRYGPGQIGAASAQQAGQTSSVTVTAQSAWDSDDGMLTYQLIRDGRTASPVATTTLPTVGFWTVASRPAVTLTDPGATAGQHTYAIRAVDGGGGSVQSAASTIAVTGPNYALGQVTSQSSVKDGFGSSRAVDGNTDGVLLDNSVTHTNPDPFSWWQVDLGQTRNLTSVNVFNRTDCCGERLNDYWVFVSSTPFNTSLTPTAQAAAGGVWSSHRAAQAGSPSTIPAAAKGRYVMIQENTPNQYLSLAEVQTFGSDLVRSDLALGGPATQSSTFGGSAAASRAVDGNTNGDFNAGSVSHTNADPFSWWQVDLGQSRQLGSITVFNRTDCCSSRLSDYDVFVSATPFDTSLTPAAQAARAGVWSSHQTTQAGSPTTIPASVTGRYVMVQLNTANQFLALAEVQVFSP